MPVEPKIQQQPGEVIDVERWEADTEFEYSLQGAKPKRALFCPNPVPRGFLLGNHRYVFKTPSGRAAYQIWSEIIAYELSKQVQLIVPPAFLAVDERTGTPGALIEFFFGHQGDPPERFVHAIDMFQGAGQNVDYNHGSLRDNIALCRASKIVDWKDWWGRTIAFDALIGNTDRHSQNWGFLVAADPAAVPRYRLAPAFDNGTSLGAGIRDEDLKRYLERDQFVRFIDRGTHHVNWLSGMQSGAQLAALCRQFIEVFGGANRAMSGIVDLRDSAIESIMQWCTRFDFPVRFTDERAEFVCRLLKARRDAVARAVRG